eukprot:12189613-Alexandrium_andersonii.AAC.1
MLATLNTLTWRMRPTMHAVPSAKCEHPRARPTCVGQDTSTPGEKINGAMAINALGTVWTGAE